MDDNELREHLNYFRQQIILEPMYEFAQKMDEFKLLDLSAFNKATSRILNEALDRFIVERNLPRKSEEIDTRLMDCFHSLAAQALNALMPFDYPYAMGLLETKDPHQLERIVIRRTLIPDHRDWVSRGNVPKFVTESNEAYAEGKLHYEKTFTPDGFGGLADPEKDPEGLEPKEPH